MSFTKSLTFSLAGWTPVSVSSLLVKEEDLKVSIFLVEERVLENKILSHSFVNVYTCKFRLYIPGHLAWVKKLPLVSNHVACQNIKLRVVNHQQVRWSIGDFQEPPFFFDFGDELRDGRTILRHPYLILFLFTRSLDEEQSSGLPVTVLSVIPGVLVLDDLDNFLLFEDNFLLEIGPSSF